MRAVSISCDAFEPLNSVCVPHNVVQDLWPVLFNPEARVRTSSAWEKSIAYHGSSDGRVEAEPLAGALPLAVEEDMVVDEDGCVAGVT